MNRKLIKDSNFVLRNIFYQETNEDILINFIETFLEIEIRSLKINKSPNKTKKREYGVVDVRIITKENKELNVGIQVVDGDYIQNKMLLYYAKIHSNQVLYGDNRKIVKTITINILDIAYFKSYNYHKVINIKSNIINDEILERIDLHVLELPKFNKKVNVPMTKKDYWVVYLKGDNEKQMQLAKKYNKYIKKLDLVIEKYWEDEII
ncbi:MAG: Rpn family recombination-promoting nuclease/putative transposase [Clostridia bacterium]|nr:Rpn family recombination-promoting nuclease/putative transposase [Clostridia bacterium]